MTYDKPSEKYVAFTTEIREDFKSAITERRVHASWATERYCRSGTHKPLVPILVCTIFHCTRFERWLSETQLAGKTFGFAGPTIMQNHRTYWEPNSMSYHPSSSSGSKDPSGVDDVAGIPLTQQLKHNQSPPLHFPTRSSLGQFIERSTSAPPLSSITAPDDDAAQLLENAAQLLENVSFLAVHNLPFLL